MSLPMKYEECLEYMESLQGVGIRPGLESIRELCRRLGDPQSGLRFVHIAGTNGKGSVLAYLSSVLRAAGYRVGSYSSPAVFDYRERICVNGRPIPKAALCRWAERIRGIREEMLAQTGLEPTAFEVETALAFAYFREKRCDIVVLECGMGGRLDATNLVDNTLAAVITSVGRDHMKFLGNTLTEIAAEKAGILKKGCTTVIMEQEPQVTDVVRERARELGCDFVVSGAERVSHVKYGRCTRRGIGSTSFSWRLADGTVLKNLEIPLCGRFQVANAALALTVLETLADRGFPVKEEALRRGLHATVWHGRFEVIGTQPLFVIDGAHNEDAARKLADTIGLYFAGRRMIFIMGVLRDKEYDKIIALTAHYADQIITVTPPDNPRALSALELAQAVSEVHLQVTTADSVEEAAELARLLAGPDDVILAFGSLSYFKRIKRTEANHANSI